MSGGSRPAASAARNWSNAALAEAASTPSPNSATARLWSCRPSSRKVSVFAPWKDGGYAVAGSTSSFGAEIDDAWVLKLDAGGNVLWQKTYGGSGDDSAYSIVATAPRTTVPRTRRRAAAISH